MCFRQVLSHNSEENVYMLCKKLAEKGLCKSDFSDLVVMFVSNKSRQVETAIIFQILYKFTNSIDSDYIMVPNFWVRTR